MTVYIIISAVLNRKHSNRRPSRHRFRFGAELETIDVEYAVVIAQ